MGERSDGLLVALRFYDCVLNCSSTLWLLPCTLYKVCTLTAHPPVRSLIRDGTSYGLACASCKWLPRRQAVTKQRFTIQHTLMDSPSNHWQSSISALPNEHPHRTSNNFKATRTAPCPCRALTSTLFLAAMLLRAPPDGRPVVPGRPVPTDGLKLSSSFGPAAGPSSRCDQRLQPRPLAPPTETGRASMP